MSVMGRWIWGRAARLVDQALTAHGAKDGTVAVVDGPELRKLLADQGCRVIPFGSEGQANDSGEPAGAGTPAKTPPSDLAAVVGPSGPGDWEAAIAGWCQAVRNGGTLILVGRDSRTEQARRALCAGLVDLAQRTAGRAVVTSGRVRRLPGPVI